MVLVDYIGICLHVAILLATYNVHHVYESDQPSLVTNSMIDGFGSVIIVL